MVRQAFRIFALFLCVMFVDRALAQDPLHPNAEEDSTVSQTPDDQNRYYRPSFSTRQKSLNITMNEYTVKSNISRLSYYAQKQSTNTLFGLQDIFIQANDFPEEVKNRMFGLAILGGVAREVFQQTRKQLQKRSINFVYPNLHGVNLTYPVRSLNAQFYFRTIDLTDRYYMLYLGGGKYTFLYREAENYTQNGLYYRLYKNLRLFAVHTQYPSRRYNGFGFSHHSKKLFLYATFSQNIDFPQYNRLYLFVNILFD